MFTGRKQCRSENGSSAGPGTQAPFNLLLCHPQESILGTNMATPVPYHRTCAGAKRQEGERYLLPFQKSPWESHTSRFLKILMARTSPSHAATPSCQGNLANVLLSSNEPPKLEMEKGYWNYSQHAMVLPGKVLTEKRNNLALVIQSCLTICDSINCSLPGSSV